MSKRGVIKILMGEEFIEIPALIMSPQWAIHRSPNADIKTHYVLTHIPSGKRVWSASTQTFLKELIQEPEFFEPLDDLCVVQVNRIGEAIKRFCSYQGWK